LRAALNRIIRNVKPGQMITVLAGAGVSLAAPANLPTAYDFKQSLARSLLQFDENPKDIINLPQVMKDRQVPFEGLLQQIYDTMFDSHPKLINHLLISTFGIGKPNQNHKILSEYLIKGKIHFLLTTNFDNLFEAAGGDLRQVVSDSQWERFSKDVTQARLRSPVVAHLHGSLNQPSSLITLMSQVGREVQGPKRRVLDYAFKNGVMVFIGYSGTDEDINPLVEDYPPERQWWLLKPGDTPDQPRKQQYYNVQLVPRKSTLARGIFDDLFKSLSQSDIQNLGAAILVSVGMYIPAILRLANSLHQKPIKSARLTYAIALHTERYFHLTEKLLKNTPSREWIFWPNWIDILAFTQRHLGKFEDAAQTFKQLRSEMERKLGNIRQRDQLVSELMQITEHEIEALLLIAAFKRRDEKEIILSYCEKLLDKCRFWLGNTRKLAPTYEVYYYEAEIALLRGETKIARNAYQLYEEKGAYWSGYDLITLVSLRQAVVEATSGNMKEAFHRWHRGFNAARLSAPITAHIQYLIILPALLISPLSGYWFTRILAAQLYGFYGKLKFILLMIWYPELGRKINQSLH